MGFNKRFITEDLLRQIYKNDGYQLLIDNITKPDALYIGDEFSEKIVDLISNGESEEMIKECFEYKNI
jgi:hypothetical protein